MKFIEYRDFYAKNALSHFEQFGDFKNFVNGQARWHHPNGYVSDHDRSLNPSSLTYRALRCGVRISMEGEIAYASSVGAIFHDHMIPSMRDIAEQEHLNLLPVEFYGIWNANMVDHVPIYQVHVDFLRGVIKTGRFRWKFIVERPVPEPVRRWIVGRLDVPIHTRPHERILKSESAAIKVAKEVEKVRSKFDATRAEITARDIAEDARAIENAFTDYKSLGLGDPHEE